MAAWLRALPPAPPVDDTIELTLPPAAATSDALRRRPELQQLRATIQRVKNRIALADYYAAMDDLPRLGIDD